MDNNIVEKVLEMAVQVQQIPAPTFDERLRAEFVRDRFAAEGLVDVQLDEAGNVLGRLAGSGRSLPLVISAHMDTVFPMETDISFHREGGRIHAPGIGDNSLGVAALFGVLWALREDSFKAQGDIWLAANTCEEGLGDLRGMRKIVQRFGSQVSAYLVLEGLALGHVYHRGVGVRRYKVTSFVQGGHAWSDYGRPSAIHEISRLIATISDFELPINPRTSLNIGRVAGGTSINTIASTAWFELDLRSEDPGRLAWLIQKAENAIFQASRPGVRFEVEKIGERPAGEISAGHPLIKLATSCLEAQGIQPVLTIGSTDANIPISLGYPALVLGISNGGGAHTQQEYIETIPVEKGLEHIVEFVKRLWL